MQRLTDVPTRLDITQHSELYKVAYAESQRTLDDQLDELNRMRDRAVQFAAFVGTATAFLVGTGLLHAANRDWSFYLLASLATACSTAFLAFLLTLLSPTQRKRWYSRLSAGTLIHHWIEQDVPPANETQFIRALAELYDGMSDENRTLLRSVRSSYRWLIFFGSTQIVIWAVLVWAKA